MPLVGGGGAGNVAGGANPAGVGTSLNIIGDHCYAYSGPIQDAGSGSAATTALKFTTGSYYSVVDFGQYNDHAGGQNYYILVTMDGQTVLSADFDTSTYDNGMQPVPLLIPPFTNVEVKWGIDTVTETITFYMVGRIHA